MAGTRGDKRHYGIMCVHPPPSSGVGSPLGDSKRSVCVYPSVHLGDVVRLIGHPCFTVYVNPVLILRNEIIKTVMIS